MSGWKPIETAPRDGTPVILTGPYKSKPSTATMTNKPPIVDTGYYKHGIWTGYYKHGIWQSGSLRMAGNPTHWMPMPEPPEPELPNVLKSVGGFQVGDIVRTTEGCRVRKAQPAWDTKGDTRNDDIEILEIGRFWRHCPAIMGMNLRRGTKHLFLEKNLVKVT